jgi:magnesium transporter
MRIPHVALVAVSAVTDATFREATKKKDSEDDGSRLQQWSSFIGIITAVVGNLLISFALNTQRYAHIRIEQEYNRSQETRNVNGHQKSRKQDYGSTQEQIAEERRKKNLELGDGDEDTGDAESQRGQEKDDDEGRSSYLKSPYWWLGLVLMIIGEAGNFLAYGFAPASIVSPLGVVALISNCLIAPLMLKERFRKRDLLGVLIAIAGAVVVVLSARNTEAKLGPDELWETIERWEFLTYVIITLVSIAVLIYIEPKYGRRTILVDLGLVALCGAYTALSTKGVSSLLSASLYKAFAFPIFYLLVLVLVVSALLQIRYLNRALQNYNSTQVIPTQFVLFTLSVIIGSAVLYRDFEHTTLEQIVKFVVGCLLTFFGVYLITSQRHESDDDAEDGNEEDETIQLLDEEAQGVDERTPLRRDPSKLAAEARTPQLNVETPDEEDTRPRTPRRRSVISSEVPSISVTPAESSESLKNPWQSSTEDLVRPHTPPSQLHNTSTPYFTPATSKPPVLDRSSSSPADPETPTKPPRSPRPPSPSKAALPPPDDPPTPQSFLTRSARGSISRLIPGPLMPPLSSSLSAVIADSILKGEGAPRSVRAALRRSRSGRHTNDERRRTVAVDADDPLTALHTHWANRSAESDLTRSRTHEAAARSTLGNADEEELPKKGKTKPPNRHRSLSETLGGLMRWQPGRKEGNGKSRADE